METTINKVEIQGFLGRDAEVRNFDSGHSLVTMSLATSEKYKNSKGEVGNKTQAGITFLTGATKKTNQPIFLRRVNLCL